MARLFQVKLAMPVVTDGFSASYSRVEKPTGLQYIVLSIIQSAGYATETWRDVMDSMGLTDDMFNSLFRDVIGGMLDNMIVYDYGNFPENIDIEDGISMYHLTESGKDAFSRGVITVKPEPVSGTLLHLPGKNDSSKYLSENKMKEPITEDMTGDRFRDIEMDPDMAEGYVSQNRSTFGITQKDADIFDFMMDGAPELRNYAQNINMEFDGTTGEFIIREGDHDQGFVKNRFVCEDLMKLLSANVFESPVSEVKFTAWNEDDGGWDRFMLYLPSELSFNHDKFVICSPKSCQLKGDDKRFIPFDGLEADMLSIQSKSIGYEYKLISRDVSVRGLEGTYRCNLVMVRSVDSEHISNVLKDIIASMDTADLNGFMKAAGFLSCIDDQDYGYGLLESHLKTCENMVRSLTEIRSVKGLSGILSDIAENVLSESGLPVREQADILRRADMKVNGAGLARNADRSTWNRALRDADLLLTVSNNKLGVLRAAEVSDAIPEIILRGTDFEPASSEFSKAAKMHENMSFIMKELKMTDLNDYEFDIDYLRESCSESLPKQRSAAVSEFRGLSGFMEPEGRRMIEQYLDIFEDICLALKDNVKLEKANGRMLGVLLGTELEENLRAMGLDGSLGSMIKQAHEKGLISDDDHRELENIRGFRNECAHSAIIETKVNDSKKNRWINTVRKLQPGKDTGEKKGKRK